MQKCKWYRSYYHGPQAPKMFTSRCMWTLQESPKCEGCIEYEFLRIKEEKLEDDYQSWLRSQEDIR